MRELMGRLGHASPVVFDVGANKGDTAALFRGMFPGSTVHAFEPFPETIAMLRERFGGDDAVRIVEAAVSREAGRATFHVNHAHATNSLLARPEESERFYPKNAGPKGEIEVATISLDDYCDAQGIERVALLKLDIQGGELMAIGGAQRLLGEGRVDVVYSEIQFVELYEGAAQFDQVWGEMRRLGYWLFDVYDLHRWAALVRRCDVRVRGLSRAGATEAAGRSLIVEGGCSVREPDSAHVFVVVQHYGVEARVLVFRQVTDGLGTEGLEDR